MTLIFDINFTPLFLTDQLTFDPGRLFRDERIAHVLGDPGIGAPGEDPGPRGLGRLQKALPETSLEPRLELEIGLSPGHCDEEFGLFQAPFSKEQSQNQLGLRVVRKTDVLWNT